MERDKVVGIFGDPKPLVVLKQSVSSFSRIEIAMTSTQPRTIQSRPS